MSSEFWSMMQKAWCHKVETAKESTISMIDIFGSEPFETIDIHADPADGLLDFDSDDVDE